MNSTIIKIILILITLVVTTILATLNFPYIFLIFIATSVITGILSLKIDNNKIKEQTDKISNNYKGKANNLFQRKNWYLILIVIYIIYFIAGYMRYSSSVDRIKKQCTNPQCVSYYCIKEGLNEGFHNTIYYLIKPYHSQEDSK